jgi:hypothetical protein
MTSLRWSILSFLCLSVTIPAGGASICSGETAFDSLVVMDSTVVALWHFDEASPSIVIDSTGKHDGVASGTQIVQGIKGNARYFNGSGDGIFVPSDSFFDMDSSSFSIELWFRTTQQNSVLFRRGLAPVPGYMISLSWGTIVGMIGNRGDSVWPDTLVYAQTARTYNDSLWHSVRFVRDRGAKKLLLFVDDTLAAPPVEDLFVIPLNSDRPLTIGRWEAPSEPWYFEGTIDEVKLLKVRRTVLYPVKLVSTPSVLSFGLLKAGTTDSLEVRLTNIGYSDTLHISSITSTSPWFSTSEAGPLDITKGDTASIVVRYTPVSAGRDTGTIVIGSNDPQSPIRNIPVTGQAYAMGHAPSVTSITLLPYYYWQVRVSWIRSIDDSAGAADPALQYSVWRSADNAAWSLATTLPAAGFERYSADIPLPYDYQNPYAWDYIVVAVQTKEGNTYKSAVDSLQPYMLSLGVESKKQNGVPGRFSLRQNYPNPFNPSTTIEYDLPVRSPVRLYVYNAIGQSVGELVHQEQDAGSYRVEFNGNRLASGVYFCRLIAGSYVETRKILLMK